MTKALGREAPGDDVGRVLMCSQALYTAVMNAFETASWDGRIRGIVDNALFKILPCNE